MIKIMYEWPNKYDSMITVMISNLTSQPVFWCFVCNKYSYKVNDLDRNECCAEVWEMIK